MRSRIDIPAQLSDAVSSFWKWTFACVLCWNISFGVGMAIATNFSFDIEWALFSEVLAVFLAPISIVLFALCWVIPLYFDLNLICRLVALLLIIASGMYAGHSVGEFRF